MKGLAIIFLILLAIAAFTSTPEQREATRAANDKAMQERQERIDFIDNVIRPD
jgi:hypothetical protein